MAKTTVAELVAKFTGDTSGLEKSIGKATAAVAKFGIAAGTAAAAPLIVLTKAQMKVVDENAKLADSLGVSIERFEDMKLVADEAGVSSGQLAQTMTLLQRNIVEAASGTGPAADALNAMGLSVKNLINLSPDRQFEKVAEAISGIENPTARTALAMDLFGKSGRGVINMMTDFKARVDEAAAFNDKFNLSLSRVDAAKIEAANDAFGRVGKVVQGLGNTIAVELSPIIEYMSNALVNSGISGENFGEAVKKGMAVAAAAIDIVRQAVLGFKLMFKAVVAGMLDAVSMAVNALVKFDNLVVSILNKIPKVNLKVKDSLVDLSKTMSFVHDEGVKDIGATVEEMKNFESISKKISQIQANADYKQSQALIKKAGSATMGIDFDALKTGTKETKESFADLKQAIEDNRRASIDLKNQMADSFSGMISSIANGESALNSLRKTALSVLNDVVNSMFRLSFGGESGGGIGGFLAESLFGSLGLGGTPNAGYNPAKAPPPIKPFARGGVVSGASMFPIGGNMGVMGEAGPEAIMPLTRGPGGKLGVANHGGGGKTLNQTINVQTGVSQTVRAEIMRMLPQIKQVAVSAVQDAQNRNALGA